MTRTTAALTSVIAVLAIAFTAVPASASDGYESLNAITGPTQSSGDQPSGYESINAITGPVESSAEQSGGYESINAITGPVEAEPSLLPTVEVSESSRFDWGDAGIGAASTLVLLLTAAGAARLVARRRHSTVESTA